MSIEMRFSPERTEALLRALREKPGRVLAILFVRVVKLTEQLAARIVSTKLSGQVLHRRTGILAASVHAVTPQIDVANRQIRGRVQAAASPAEYGRYHEFGVPHSWAVVATRARALSFVMDGRQRFYKSVIHRSLPARSFMQSTLDESAAEIRASLQEAVNEELDKP